MTTVAEKCTAKKTEYTPPDFHISKCEGNAMPNPDDHKTEELDQWVSTFIGMETVDVDDLVCAWEARKIALLDFDDWPNEDNPTDVKGMFIRHLMTRKCEIRSLSWVTGDNLDTNTIYYHPRLWKEALLLYLYYHDIVPLPSYPPPSFPASDHGQYNFDLFQGILLGYSRESIYQLTHDFYRYFITAAEKATSQTFERHVPLDMLRKNVIDALLRLPSEQRHDFYQEVYASYYHSDRYTEFIHSYRQVKKDIYRHFDRFEASPELKAFAKGLSFLDLLRLNPSKLQGGFTKKRTTRTTRRAKKTQKRHKRHMRT